MWKEIAQKLDLEIPEQQMERISPVLDRVWSDIRRVLDRDLSELDPAVNFHPDLRGEP